MQSHLFMANRWGKVETVTDFIFLGSKIIPDGDWSHEIRRCLLLGRKVMMNLDSILNGRNITLPTEVCIVKVIGFSSSHVWMWELDHKEGWAPKNWCFWTIVLEKTLESLLDYKEIKPVNPKGSQSWIFIWASSRNWWWTGKPGMLQSMVSKELVMTERLNWSEQTDIFHE